MITTVAILVGGKGTRLAGFLGEVPKPLAPIGGVPLLEVIIKKLTESGVRKILLLTGHKSEAFERYNNSRWNEADVKCIYENEPLGSAGALLNARSELVDTHILLLNGDTYLDTDYSALLINDFSEDIEAAIGLCRVDDVGRYGCVDVTNEGIVNKFIEKGGRGPGLVNSGAFIVKKDLLKRIENVKKTREKMFLTLENDIFPELISHKKLCAFTIPGGFVDIGIPASYCEFNVDTVLRYAQEELHGFFMIQVLISLLEGRRIVCIADTHGRSSALISFLKENPFVEIVDSYKSNLLLILAEEDLMINAIDGTFVGAEHTRAQCFNLSNKPLSNAIPYSVLDNKSWINRLSSLFSLIVGCRGHVLNAGLPKRPALFLDRDGVLIKYVPYIKLPEDVELRDGVDGVIKWAHDKMWPVILVTNQSGIEKGKYTESDFVKVQHRALSDLAEKGEWIDRVFYSKFFKSGVKYSSLVGPNLRKPDIGMFTKASSEFNIDIKESVFIGDSESDIKAGINAGISKILVLKSDVCSTEEWNRLQKIYEKQAVFVLDSRDLLSFIIG